MLQFKPWITRWFGEPVDWSLCSRVECGRYFRPGDGIWTVTGRVCSEKCAIESAEEMAI